MAASATTGRMSYILDETDDVLADPRKAAAYSDMSWTVEHIDFGDGSGQGPESVRPLTRVRRFTCPVRHS